MRFNDVTLEWPLPTGGSPVAEFRIVATNASTGAVQNTLRLPADATSAEVGQLGIRGATYRFVLQAVDAYGDLSQLEAQATTITQDTVPPAWTAGSEISITRLLQNRVEMLWPAAEDNVQVRFYRPFRLLENDSWVEESTVDGWTTVFERTGLTPETEYTYKVVAEDSSYNRCVEPLMVTFTTPGVDTTAPVWPDDAEITVSDRASTSFKMTWPAAIDDPNAADLLEYRIYQIVDVPGGGTQRVPRIGTKKLSETMKDLTRGEVTSWEVVAVDFFGNQSVPLELHYTVLPEDLTPPAWLPGAAVTVPEVGFTNALVSWTEADDTTVRYRVYVREGGADGPVLNNTIQYVGKTIHQWTVGHFSDMHAGGSYTACVEAIDEWDNASVPLTVPFTTITVDTTPPAWPEGSYLRVVQFSGGSSVLLEWSEATEWNYLKAYEINGTDSSGQGVPFCPYVHHLSPSVNPQRAWIHGLTPGETYTFSVQGIDLAGNKSPLADSPTVSVTMPEVQMGSMSAGGGEMGGASIGAADAGAPASVVRAVASLPSAVAYDPTYPRITSVQISQPDGPTTVFDPVGRFVFVYQPSRPVSVDVTFDDPSRVSDLRLSVGSKSIQQPGPATTVNPMMGMVSDIGKAPESSLYATYSVAPMGLTAGDLANPPDEEAIRSAMPGMWREATVSGGGMTYDPDTGRLQATAWGALGDPRATFTVTMTIDDVDGAAPEGIPPVSDFQWSLTPNENPDGTGTIQWSVGMVVPTSLILSDASGMMHSQGLLDTPAKLVWIFGENAITAGLSLSDLFRTANDAFDNANYDLELDQLLLSAESRCNPAAAARHRSAIEMERRAADMRTTQKNLLGLASVAVGLVSGGVGVAVGSAVIQLIAEAKWDAEQQVEFNRIKNDIANDELCQKPMDEEEYYQYSKKLLAEITWIMDPSGYVFEAVPENRVEGVTATCLVGVPSTAPGAGPGDKDYVFWDAEPFFQQNPVLTDAEGRYAWDVPAGMWKVRFDKDGYETAYSAELPVPPPQLDVNVGMTSLQPPAVSEVRGLGGTNNIRVSFSKHMLVSSVTGLTVTVSTGDLDEFGSPVYLTGVLTPVNPAEYTGSGGAGGGGSAGGGAGGAGGGGGGGAPVQIAKDFLFESATPINAGQSLTVRVSQAVKSYAGVMMASDHTAAITMPAAPISVTGVSLDKTSMIMRPGETRLLVATVSPANADDPSVTWSSDNAAVASVNDAGLVTANGIGTTTIRVTTVDGGFTATCQVTVAQAPTGGGDTGGGGTGGVTAPADSAQKFRTFLGSGAMSVSSFGGEVRLVVPSGAFPAGAALDVVKSGPVQVPPGYAAGSEVFDIAFGAVPQEPVQLQVLCDMPVSDPLKLGVYRWDVERSTWTYIGGALDLAEGVLRVNIRESGRYVVMAYEKTFSDLAGHWSQREVELLASRHVVSGVTANTFEPERQVTRAEFVKLVMSMNPTCPVVAAKRLETKETFADVPHTEWYYPYVEAAYQLGRVTGAGGYFRPHDPISREEMAVILARTLGNGGGSSLGPAQGYAQGSGTLPLELDRFTDASDISSWALDGVVLAVSKGLLRGDPGGTFRPKDPATRAEAAVVILRAMEARGLLRAPTEVSGILRMVSIGGPHYELHCGVCPVEYVQYVLIPAEAGIEEQLAALVEKEVKVTGILQGGFDAYMRGPVLKVTAVEAVE